MISLPDGNLQSGPDCCNLQSGRTQMLCNNNELHTNPDCRGSDCRTGLQSGKHHNNSMTYSQFQIASALPVTYVTVGNQPTVKRKGLPHPGKVVKQIRFATTPKIGTVLLFEGQRYELIDQVPHIRVDGQPTTLLHWQSHCAECGTVFVTKTVLVCKHINRRCEAHHRKGPPVVPRRKNRTGGSR